MRLKSGWINLLLLVLVLALGSLLWLQPGLHDPGSSVAPLTDIDPAQVRSLRILARGKPDIELEKHSGRWLLIRPVSGPAKTKPVQTLLRIATQPSAARFPASELDLEPFGLANGGLRLQLDGRELAFGTTDPVHYRRYVLFEDRVHLIEDRAYHHLVGGAEALLEAPAPRSAP